MANPTTNYSFAMPTNTDLVKDLPADFEVFGQAVDTQMKTNADAAIAKSLVTTKGDLIAATSASTPARLAVGTDGQVLQADSTAATGVKWATPSSGATTWTNRLTGDGTQFNCIAWNGSNLYVAVGHTGKLYSSTNATSWTSRTSGFGSNNINSVAYGNGIFVAVGANGTLTTSTDGTTWTARTSNMSTNAINRVIYDNSLFVAVGAGGGITNTGGLIYSTDGITWTRKSQSLTNGAIYKDVIWNGTNWIIVGTMSDNNYIYATTPSGTWTAAVDTGSGGDGLQSILWDGTRAVYNTDSQIMYQSTSTTLGAPAGALQVSVFTTANCKALYNGVVYTGRRFLNRFIPSSSFYPATDVSTTLPIGYENSSGVFNNGPTMNAILINSTGTIIADTSGKIWTSF